MESKVIDQFYNLVSKGGTRTSEEYKKWNFLFLKHLYDESKVPPHYLNDDRTLLLFRKYDENKIPLSSIAQKLRWIHSLRLWLAILKQDMKDEYIDLDPADFIATHSWSKDLISNEKAKTLQQTELLYRLIETASSDGEGLFPCPECHSKKFVKSHTEQRARCDEGMTTVNICSNCNNKKWTVRG